MKTPKRNIRFLEESEIRQIIDAIPDDLRRGRRDRAFIEVLFSTGLRVSEALALKRNDLLHGDPNKTLELMITGKGGVQRCVYVSPQARQAVIRYFAGRMDTDDRAFPLTTRGANMVVKIRAKLAGIEKFVSPHVFRHSFATNLLKKGISIFYVQQFLGHKNLSTTSVYLHTSNKELKDIHEKLYSQYIQ